MTTGSYSHGADPNRETKTWSGGDGKYVIVNGKQQIRYNNYTLNRTRHSGVVSAKYGYIMINANRTRLMPDNGIVMAQSKLVSKVRDHDFHLGKFVAEGKETVNLVVDTIKTVAMVIHKLKRADLVGAARTLGIDHHSFRTHDVSGRWLELQYGWLPLIGDVYEAAKAFSTIADPPRRSRVMVKKHLEDEVDTSISPSNWSGKGVRSNNYRIIYEMKESLSTPRSLGLEDPVGIAWELIPYSFVVDWFIPIGTYLDNLNIIPKLEGTFIVTDVCSVQSKSHIINPAIGPLEANFEQLRVTRTVSSGLTATTPSFKSLDEAMSPKHIWNALALAHQLL